MKYIDFSSRKTKLRWLIGVLVAVLFFVLATAYVFHPRFPMRLPNQPRWQHQRPLMPENIQSWMTFEYLNFVFKLPPEYLRDTLSIQDSKYPRTTLKKYAEKTGMNSSQFVEDVQNAIESYKP